MVAMIPPRDVYLCPSGKALHFCARAKGYNHYPLDVYNSGQFFDLDHRTLRLLTLVCVRRFGKLPILPDISRRFALSVRMKHSFLLMLMLHAAGAQNNLRNLGLSPQNANAMLAPDGFVPLTEERTA